MNKADEYRMISYHNRIRAEKAGLFKTVSWSNHYLWLSYKWRVLASVAENWNGWRTTYYHGRSNQETDSRTKRTSSNCWGSQDSKAGAFIRASQGRRMIKFIRVQLDEHTVVEFVNGSRICSCGLVRGTPPNLRTENNEICVDTDTHDCRHLPCSNCPA